MKIFSKIMAAMLLAAMTVSAVACGPSEVNRGGGGGGLPSIDNPWWSTVGELEKDADGNIVFSDVQINLTSVICGNDQSGFEALLRQFQREYDNEITISHQTYNQLEIDGTVRRQIQNETAAPDLVLTHQKTHASFAADELIQPMDEAYELAGLEVDTTNFLPNFADYCDLGYEGRMFTVPVDAQSMVIYYNKNILNKYGGELPSGRTEFIELCKRVQQGERTTNSSFMSIACGVSDFKFTEMYLLPTAVAQNGGEFYDEDGRANWASGENLTAFQNGVKAIQGLSNEGIMNLAENNEGARSRFCNGNALFYISLPFDANVVFSAFAAASGHTLEVVQTQDIGGFSISGLFAMDENSEHASKIFGDSHAFMMSRTVEDIEKKAAIATFVNWFTTNVEVGIEWAKLGHTSASYAIRGNAAYNADQYVTDFNNMFYEDISNFVTAGENENYTLIFPDLQTVLLNCVKTTTNDTQIQQLLQGAQTRVNAALDLA